MALRIFFKNKLKKNVLGRCSCVPPQRAVDISSELSQLKAEFAVFSPSTFFFNLGVYGIFELSW